MKPELSTVTVEEILQSNDHELPDNFDKLSAKKQKEIIYNTVLDTFRKLVETLSYKHKAEQAKKLLTAELKRNATAVKLQKVKKELKQAQSDEFVLMERYNGMLQLAKALNFDKKLLAEIQKQDAI